ncbi:hypothetical protein A6R68_12889, partial [Neotoma lepida]
MARLRALLKEGGKTRVVAGYVTSRGGTEAPRGLETMYKRNGLMASVLVTSATPQGSSSSDSLEGQSCDYASKSYDAVVFDVLKVTPEEFAVSDMELIRSLGDILMASSFSSLHPDFIFFHPELVITQCSLACVIKNDCFPPWDGIQHFLRHVMIKEALVCAEKHADQVEIPLETELASCGWSKKEKHSLAPNVVAFTRRFNQKLLELNNLHSLMSVVSALQSAPIFRLTKTWALLNRKDKTTFEKLDYLMSKEDNYKRTRDYIRSLKMVPSIPYL